MVRADVLSRVGGRVSELAQPSDPPGAAEYVREFYAQLDDDDVEGRSVDSLAAAALEQWRLGKTRDAHQTLVHVYTPPRGHTAVDVIVEDMPFVVDSVMMALDRHGLGIHLVVHPILCVLRSYSGELQGMATAGQDAPDDLAEHLESWTHIEVDRETSSDILDAVRTDLERVLGDVRAATTDWLKMVAAAEAVRVELEHAPPPCNPLELQEGKALLGWLIDDHFTFLGYRAYDLASDDALCPVPGSGLGLLRGAPEHPSKSFAALPAAVRAKAREKTLLVLTKANARSSVHRPTYLDYVGIKRYDAGGRVIGEHRFLGLYTSSAYTTSPRSVPVLRRKVTSVLERAGFLPASHDQKDLVQILETYPRDDLFQIDVDSLYQNAMGILRLQERRRVRLFVHREPYGRFVSCLVYLPRDRYTTNVRIRVARLLVDAFGASSHEWNTRLSASVLARLHYVLRVDAARPRAVDLDALEQKVASAARAWVDDLRDVLIAARGEETGLDAMRVWTEAFPAAYQSDFNAPEALADLVQLERLDADTPLAVRLALDPESPGALDLKLYGIGAQPSLSDVLPRLANLGVVVNDEHPYEITPAGTDQRWIKWFRVRPPAGQSFEPSSFGLVEDAFLAVVDGRAEDDGFNRLVLGAGLAWREVALLRAYCRYLRQTGTLFSQRYLEDTLAAHAPIARRLVGLFNVRFDPWATEPSADAAGRLTEEIRRQLDAVTGLDEDRILRSLLHLVCATLRTNWFQDPEPACVALKFDPTQIPDLPLPRPLYEIFVYSPRVEGVHLRAGRVARGGIRWSDRREDFRTEVLGLMKAQRVKNAVIVPTGAKGGFVVKRPPAESPALHAELEACYRLFISALLDVTDNLDDQVVIPPPLVVRYDDDDPYLVVAADKGTAQFSDVANEIAMGRGFWLGDAFASGGEHGYDHKTIGITARGAWESVRRHFRHLGIDPDQHDFSAVGIGDMSGDVFGNGMLLSQHIRLVAAFDHRHVFLDPDPDALRSYRERQRLFELAESSWDDYDRSLISTGGGVYSRELKAIPVSAEMRSALGIGEGVKSLTPADVIRALLQAPVDLLYNGGIGTYVKAHDETDADAGDKANDTVRVDGRDVRARCVAEGGNLGFTQRGRVEYALTGGRINTDAIDNSAGVDTSDHEVNIKILLDGAVRTAEMSEIDRNALLVGMTDEVAALVLRDNYRQNRALDSARAQAVEMEEVHSRYIRALESAHDLDREVEGLPSDEQLAERADEGAGLTAPELAVLLAYAKITLEEDLLAGPLPDDPDFLSELLRTFPTGIQTRFLDRIRVHPLRREITATSLANGVVNRSGVTFVFRLGEETGAAPAEIVRAHEAARAIFDQEQLWRAIEALDARIEVDTQTDMYLAARRLVERATRWLLRNRRRPLPVAATVAEFAPAVAPLREMAALAPEIEPATAAYAAQGVPTTLARQIASLDRLPRALDVAELARAHDTGVEEVATAYNETGAKLRLDWLADRISELPHTGRWDSLARNALREDLAAEQRSIIDAVMTAGGYDVWASEHATDVARLLRVLDELRAHGVVDVTTLAVALREVRALSPTDQPG